MDQCFPFRSVNGDRTNGAQDVADLFAVFFTTGVSPAPANSLQVMAGGGMTVRLQPGSCCIQGRVGKNNVVRDFVLPVAHGALPRIDRLVLQMDRTGRWINEVLKVGVPASSRAPPALRRDGVMWELCAGEMRVPAGAASITQSLITDRRPDPALCGWLGLVDGKVTSDLFAQWDDTFRRWFDAVRGMLSEDAAGNLAAQIITMQSQIINLRTRIIPVSLPLAGWAGSAAPFTQTVSADVLAGGLYTYLASPDPASHVIYTNAGVVMQNIATNGSVTFHAQRRPTIALNVNLVRWALA